MENRNLASKYAKQVDENVFKKLGANVTYDAVYEGQKLYHK